MKNKDVGKMSKALGLERHIVGLRFLYFRHEFENLKVEEYGKKPAIV